MLQFLYMQPEENESLDISFESTEKKIEALAGELEVKFPKGTLPFAIRIITLVLIIGGLSILGSVFTDFSIPKNGGFTLYVYRLITGIVFVVVAYGMYIRQRWAVWLYGTIVFIGLFLNFSLTIIPALLVIYLYTKRKLFVPCFLDDVSSNFFNKFKSKFK